MHRFLQRGRYLMRARRLDAELAEEMSFHQEMTRRELADQGATAEEAASGARRRFGSAALARDQARDVWTWMWLQELWRDVRFAVRLFRRDRAVTAIAVLVLGLGIGIDNTLFVAVNAACFRGLPIAAPHRVFAVDARDSRGHDLPLSYRELEALRVTTGGIVELAASANVPMAVGDDGRVPERIAGTYISWNAFRLLGEHPLLGRDFDAQQDQPGAARAVILGYGLWRSRYASDPAIIGRTIRIDAKPSLVVGVMREGFKFPGFTGVWLPLTAMPALTTDRRTARALTISGRLLDGATIAQLRDQLALTAASMAHDFPETNREIGITAVPINNKYTNRITDPQWLSMMVVGAVVLLIACANVANLLLMRAGYRTHEMAIRGSIGATRGRLVRQMLIESVVLAAAGGMVGAIVAVLGGRFLTALVPETYMPYWIRFVMDGRAFAALCAICLGTVFLFGLAPALHLSGTDPHQVMKDGGRSTIGGLRARRWTTSFLSVEVALTVMMLASLVKGAQQQRQAAQADLAFNPIDVFTASIALPADRYATPAQRINFYRQLRERLESDSAISAFAVAGALPLAGAAPRQMEIDGRPPQPADAFRTVWTVTAGPRYFETLGVQVVRGREFNDRDGEPGTETAVVNQRLVSLYFPDGDAVGKRIQLSNPGAAVPAPGWFTIAGVVQTVRHRQASEPDPIVYLPIRPTPPAVLVALVRTVPDAHSIAPLLRDTIRGLDADVPLSRPMSMEEALVEAQWASRGSIAISRAVVAVAIILAAVGLFGVTAYAVVHLTGHIGLCLALGARRRHVAWLVSSRIVLPLGAGLAGGVGCTWVWQRVFGETSANYGVIDLFTLVQVALLLGVIAAVACIAPLWRAMRIQPAAALRCE